MNNKNTKILTTSLLGIIGLIFIYFLLDIFNNGYWIWGNSLDMATTGQFGDFIGGFLGSIINGAAFFFLYLNLRDQRDNGQKQIFETRLYDLIRIHRENVNDLSYTKYENEKMHTADSRKVFRLMVREFLEIYQEVKRFTKIYPDKNYLNPNYYNSLNEIKKQNNCRASVEQLALIDISYSFFYFGLTKESDSILLHKFYNRYNKNFVHKLKIFLQLKPKEEICEKFEMWNKFKRCPLKEMRETFEIIYKYSINKKKYKSIVESIPLAENLETKSYYGGHQHRLGHYFRHLFQSFKFISLQSYLTDEEKYFFGKQLRTQLSTYEQFIIFFNSLSSLGIKWEYLSKIPQDSNVLKDSDFKFITRYNLIKNLPGSQYFDFSYRQYYPNVIFEYRDDITYADRIRNNFVQ